MYNIFPMHNKCDLTILIKAAQQQFGTTNMVRNWAKTSSVSLPTVRCFLRNEIRNMPTINKLIEPLGYEAQIVIRKKKVA